MKIYLKSVRNRLKALKQQNNQYLTQKIYYKKLRDRIIIYYLIYIYIYSHMVQTESQRRAKAKYYAKLRESEDYKANMAQRSRGYYQKNKEETVKKYYESNEENIYQNIKEKRDENKIKSVVSKLESIDMEVLAKILIEARKTKLLEIQEYFKIMRFF